MLAILISTLLFSILIFLGVILMFVDPVSYWLIPCFLLGLCCISRSYQKPNCRSLERKDFIWSLLFSGACCLFILYWRQEIMFYEFWYYYLSSFLSIIMFADSRRFKSLM